MSTYTAQHRHSQRPQEAREGFHADAETLKVGRLMWVRRERRLRALKGKGRRVTKRDFER